MRELITADMVKEMASKKQEQILVTSDTIITPAARDEAEALGIKIVEQSSTPRDTRRRDLNKIRETVVHFLRKEFGDQPLDEETVRTIVTKVFERLG